MPKDSIFLSTAKALAAVCRDLRQYEPQVLLICEILRILPNGPGSMHRETGATGVWIQRPGSTNMRWLEGAELIEFACNTLITAHLSAPPWPQFAAGCFAPRPHPKWTGKPVLKEYASTPAWRGLPAANAGPAAESLTTAKSSTLPMCSGGGMRNGTIYWTGWASQQTQTEKRLTACGLPRAPVTLPKAALS